jgi:Siphovirus-type tail component, C-terminal domain
MPVANDWELGFGSLLIADGSAFSIANIDGIADIPDLRINDRSRLRRHGMLPGDDFLGGRSVVVDVEVFGTNDTDFNVQVAALKQALSPGSVESPLTFKVPGVAGGGIRRLNVRPRKLALPVETKFYYRQPVASVEFFATDPRIYDDTQQSLATGLVASVAGLTWNLSWNLNWGGASTGNSFTATNGGTFSTPFTVRFDGPVTNPSVENVTTGEKLKLSADGGLVLGVGEYVELDTDARTVLLGGTASRYSKLSSDSTWFDLPPGNTTLRFLGTTAGSPTMTVTFRSAYL